jgi:hypothetical protein
VARHHGQQESCALSGSGAGLDTNLVIYGLSEPLVIRFSISSDASAAFAVSGEVWRIVKDKDKVKIKV